MIRRPPRSTLDRSSAASDVYKRQAPVIHRLASSGVKARDQGLAPNFAAVVQHEALEGLSLIHISEPTRPY